MSPSLLVDPRFNGPARSGNGGYVAGLVARHVSEDQPVTVTLRQPPPLGVPLDITRGEMLSVSSAAEGVIAEATRAADELEPIEPVAPDVARAAMARYKGAAHHPFPTCFSCGPARHDGLAIFPGSVAAGDNRVAAPWTPDETLPDLFAATWAALDCVGGWSTDIDERPMVLGRMTAVVDALPVVGEPHVVLGRPGAREGRRTSTSSTIIDSDGRVVGRAAHVWVAVDPVAFNALR